MPIALTTHTRNTIMASRGINKVILIGNLGQDPEIRYMQNNNPVANITMATSDSWRDKQTGEQKERTEWHRVVVVGKLAEFVAEYTKKGTTIYIEGKLQTRKWTDQSGQERYTTEVFVDSFSGVFQVMSNGRDNRGNQGHQPQNGNQGGQNNQRPAQNQQPQNGNQGGQNNRPAQQPQRSAAPAQQPQSAPPVYNEPPMDFDDDIPF